jgi:hypothetical protein
LYSAESHELIVRGLPSTLRTGDRCELKGGDDWERVEARSWLVKVAYLGAMGGSGVGGADI